MICFKDDSKKYYSKNKEKVLKMISNKYENSIKKNYSVKLNFNSIEEMENNFMKAKEQFLNGELKQVTRKSKKNEENIIWFN